MSENYLLGRVGKKPHTGGSLTVRLEAPVPYYELYIISYNFVLIAAFCCFYHSKYPFFYFTLYFMPSLGHKHFFKSGKPEDRGKEIKQNRYNPCPPNFQDLFSEDRERQL